MRERILKIVTRVIGEVNDEMQYENLNNPNENTIIFDGDNGIDSLSLVLLVSTVEAEINKEFSSNILVASEKAMSMRNSPFRTVDSLTTFIEAELTAS
ncbi:hypothetical protein [Muricoccus vinaceus]|uniref:Carrier domain-containing protein n=1 Tax=Muricoccus vinaceus TaxID=424704 RepID=A0ABV6IS00_9PROT